MTNLLILFLIALAVTSVGWKRFIYFVSTGYGYCVAVLAVAIGVMRHVNLTLPTTLLLVLLFIFGVRLGTFLLVRERRSTTYREHLESTVSEKKPVGVMFAVWSLCSILYVLQVSPLLFRLENQGIQVSETWVWIGASLTLCGILLEAVSDAQKSAAKRRDPKRFVDTGLYRLVRCPNYLGEIVVWTGVFLSGIGAGFLWWQWFMAALGYISIVFVMLSGARRLGLHQNKTYGNDPEYQAYVKNTPILIPFLHI